jgi:hypothetical protein
MMAREWFTIWFEDGGGRAAIHGRRELRQFAKRYDFDADEVISKGETFIIDKSVTGALDTVIGGVFKEVKDA